MFFVCEIKWNATNVLVSSVRQGPGPGTSITLNPLALAAMTDQGPDGMTCVMPWCSSYHDPKVDRQGDSEQSITTSKSGITLLSQSEVKG